MHKLGESIPFALSESDQRLHEPRAVPLGKLCGCVCPGCRQPVYAKHCMSGKRAPHFAHAPGSDCASGFETALHLAAKQLIESRGVLVFPSLVVAINVVDACGRSHGPSRELVAAGLRTLSNVVLEQALGAIRPDVRVDAEEIGAVLIEVAVTHFVDEHKLASIEQRGVAAVEIDLSMLRDATFAALETALFDDPSRTAWLYHPQVAATEVNLRGSIQAELDAAEVSAAHLAYSRSQIEQSQRAYREAQRLQDQEREALRRREAAEQRKTEDAHREVEAALDAKRKAEAEVLLRQQRHEALKKASAFKARPEEQKRIILLNRLGLSELPAFLGANVQGAMSFGVSDPLVWQTTFFGGLIHKQAAEGRGWLSVKFARAWMSYRFRIPPALAQDAANAIDGYLAALSAAGALSPCRNEFFAIAVGDLTCFETLHQIHADRSFDPSRFEWTPEEHWPCAMQVAILTQVMVPTRHKTDEWISLSRDLRRQRTREPMEICEWASGLGGSKEAVARYLVRTGFLRLKPKVG